MSEIDSSFTREVVCPYCGDEKTDSWELGEGEDIGEMECDECENTFYARRNITIDYTSERDCSLNGKEHRRVLAKHMDRCSECDVYLDNEKAQQGNITNNKETK